MMVRRSFTCSAIVGLLSAVYALQAPPSVGVAAALFVAVESALGFGLSGAVVALLIDRFAALKASTSTTKPSRIHREGTAWAASTGIASALLIITLRLRFLAGFAQPELLPLGTGPLLEGTAAGLLLFALVSRCAPRVARFAWRGLGGLAMLALLATALGAGMRQGIAQSPAATGPNILLVSIDTLRADRLGTYGRKPTLTPHLDRFADEGVVFETALSPLPLTGPSHTTMLTGLYPERHGALANGIQLEEDVRTLPEALERAGYGTAGFISGWPLSHTSSGLASRFHEYDDELGRSVLFPRAAERVPLLWLAHRTYFFARWPNNYSHGRFWGMLLARDGAETARRALSWIEAQERRPFFAFVHFYDAHGPYSPPASILADLDPSYRGSLDSYGGEVTVERRPELLADPRELKRIETLYDGDVMVADRAVGLLVDGLAELGLATDTLVIITSDHGESLTEHGELFSHGNYLYDTTQHVPLLLRSGDKRWAGRRIGAQVRLIDLAPTVLDLAGVRPLPGIDGASLLPLLEGREEAPRLAFGSAGSAKAARRNDLSRRFLRTASHKLIWTLDERSKTTGSPAFEELFALDSDPGERVNLLTGEASLDLDELRRLLRIWLSTDSSEPVEIDPETRRTLMSLGYL